MYRAVITIFMSFYIQFKYYLLVLNHQNIINARNMKHTTHSHPVKEPQPVYALKYLQTKLIIIGVGV